MAQQFIIQFAISAATTFLAYALAPTVARKGAKLQDTRVQSSTYGRYIQRLYGTSRLAGNIIWVEDNEIKEHEHTEEFGKGGGVEVTTYTYSVSMALALCDNETSGISRIWADAVLIYDMRQEDAIIQYASGQTAEKITFYLGTMDQEPDPRIQANQPDAPAYRGISYIVFEDLQLDRFGNRIPNITVEASQSSQTPDFSDRLSSEFYDPDPRLRYQYPISFNSGILTSKFSHRSAVQTVRHKIDLNGQHVGEEYNAVNLLTPNDMLGMMGTGRIGNVSGQNKWQWPAILHWESLGGLASFDVLDFLGIQTELLSIAFTANDQYMMIMCNDEFPSPAWTNGQTVPVTDWYLISVDGYLLATLVDSGTATGFSSGSGALAQGGRKGGSPGYGGNYLASCLEDDLKHWWTVYSAGNKDVRLYEIDDDNVMTKISPSKWRQSGFPATGGFAGGSFSQPLCWANDGIMITLGEKLFQNGGGGWIGVFSRHKVIATPGELLSAVVTDLCADVGIPASDIDVTSLSGTVRGYVISNPSAMLSNIEFLQLAYHFDIVESEYKLKFITRGGSSIADLSIDDLSAREKGGEIPEPLLQNRDEEMSAPKEIHVAYYDQDRDYNISQQTRTRIK